MSAPGQSTDSIDKILVGFDGGERAADALAFAGALRERIGAQLDVAAVVPFEPIPNLDLERHEAAITDLFAQIVGQAADQLGGDSFEEHRIRGRSPAKELTEAAERLGSDLLIVGSSHRGPVGRVYPGSVAAALLSGSPCPVCVVPEGYSDRDAAPVKVVGAAYDGRDESRAGLEFADRLAGELGAGLNLIGVVEYPAPFADQFARPIDMTGAERKRLEETLPEAAGALASEVGSTEVIDGFPADVLADRSAALDLLVIGSRGYGPIGSVLVGGVGSRLIRHAQCPVIVVPRRG